MFLELRHLRSLAAIDETGSLAGAAERLHLTQSALSHQIKAIESYFGVPLFLRTQKPLRLTAAGHRLLKLAHETLPRVHAMERELKRMAGGDAGRLHITIECHACFEWLMPALEHYRERWPEVEVDIRLSPSFDPLPALRQGEIDVVITTDKADRDDIAFEKLFEYESLLAVARDHALAGRAYIEPQDLQSETLITYPVERKRLDIFTRFLVAANVEPAAVRQVELTAMILQLVAAKRGVAALPDWALRPQLEKNAIAARRLGESGMGGTLYAAMRRTESDSPFLADFVGLARAARA